MSDVLIPGGRDVRATLDEPTDEARTETELDAIVVACPPHPQHGGSRSDGRLTAVSDALMERGIACLRFDYGPWDEGYGEVEDVRNAVRWAREESYDPVGVFGYSFGATLALLAATDVESDAISVLAPTVQLADDLDALAALDGLEAPVQVIHGERDSTVDWEPVVERARERGDGVTSLSGDHFFAGQSVAIADSVSEFFGRTICGPE